MNLSLLAWRIQSLNIFLRTLVNFHYDLLNLCFVSWQLLKKSVPELEFIDFGVEEVFVDDDGMLLYAPFESFGEVQKELEKRAFEILSSGFERIPQSTKSLDLEAQEEVLQLIERIEEDDDVQNIYHTLEIKE